MARLPPIVEGNVQAPAMASMDMAAAPGRAAAQAWGAVFQQSSEAYVRMRQEQDEQETISATVEATRAINELKTGLAHKKVYSPGELPDYVQVQRQAYVTDKDGNTGEVDREIPAYEVTPQLFRTQSEQIIANASNKITSQKARSTWAGKMGFRVLDDEVRMNELAIAQYEEKLRVDKIANIESMVQLGRYSDAQKLITKARLPPAETHKLQQDVKVAEIYDPIEMAIATADIPAMKASLERMQTPAIKDHLTAKEEAGLTARLTSAIKVATTESKNEQVDMESHALWNRYRKNPEAGRSAVVEMQRPETVPPELWPDVQQRTLQRLEHETSLKRSNQEYHRGMGIRATIAKAQDPMYVLSKEERILLGPDGVVNFLQAQQIGGEVPPSVSKYQYEQATRVMTTDVKANAAMTYDQYTTKYSHLMNPRDLEAGWDYLQKLKTGHPDALKTSEQQKILDTALAQAGVQVRPKRENTTEIGRLAYSYDIFNQMIEAKRRKDGFVSDADARTIAKGLAAQATDVGNFYNDPLVLTNLSLPEIKAGQGFMLEQGLPVYDLAWAHGFKKNPKLGTTSTFIKYKQAMEKAGVPVLYEGYQQYVEGLKRVK